MSETPDNLVLALLREIRADTAAIRHTQREHGHRLALEVGQLTTRREALNDATAAGITSTRVDDLADRVERLERRLELRD